MIHLLGFSRTSTMLFLLLFGTSLVFGQIGGPYTPDANTMLLLHFDGDYTNASTLSLDGVTHGDPSNFFFLANPIPNLGQCLRIDNDSQSDSAYVTVADTSYLDLTGDWTIEGWINIFTFGLGGSDWRWVPRLVIKTGDIEFWQPNYFVEMWGSTRLFSCGYHTASLDQWPQANTPINLVEVGKWYHMAFVRDTGRHLLLTIIHEYNAGTGIELASFTAADYLSFGAIDPTPVTTSMPVHIGYAGGGGDSFLDGFVDEVRISDTVREFPIPPIVANVSVLPNQPTSVSQYDIGANIFTLFSSSSVARKQLFYSTDAGMNWTTMDMTTVSGDSASASIPGQPLGTVINYYIEAEDNNGLIFQFPRDAGWQSAENYSFGVYEENTQALALTFEEGSGIPIDTSDYANPVTPFGNPQHMSPAPAGNHCLYLEGDSSLLEIDSPFLAASEYYVDFWFNPDPVMGTAAKNYCRFLNRPRDAASWSNNNFQFRINPGGLLFAAADGHYAITLDDTLDFNQWYNAKLEVRHETNPDTFYAILRLEDDQGNLREAKYVGFPNEVVPGFAPLRIGKSASTDTATYPPFFKGYYDNILMYNYAHAQLPLVNTAIDDKPGNLAFTYELVQNFPNPFNPTTEIRFTLARSEHVKLVIYDILGRKVRTLIDHNMSNGRHASLWNGRNDAGNSVASGVYVYRLETKNFVQAKKMILMK